jgi:hypothetical protein
MNIFAKGLDIGDPRSKLFRTPPPERHLERFFSMQGLTFAKPGDLASSVEKARRRKRDSQSSAQIRDSDRPELTSSREKCQQSA